MVSKTSFTSSKLKLIPPTNIVRSGQYNFISDALAAKLISYLDVLGVQSHRVLSFGYDSDNNVYFAVFCK